MRDPLNWSFPLGRIFGITIRVHLFLIVVFLGLWLRAVLYPRAPEGIGLAVAVLLGLTFLSILLHEFGHCFAARSVDGDAHEILMWPLGGFAFSDIPNTPRAHFITAAGGPLVNIILCAITSSILVAYGFIPPYNPMPTQALLTEMWNWHEGVWYGSKFSILADMGRGLTNWQFFLAQFFWINYFLFLLNVLLIGFPMDGGRMFQAILWPRLGYRQSMLTTVFIGFIVMLVVGLISIVANELLVLCLALVIFFACRQQWLILETGHEESLFGYDFSQGYTSLEQQHHEEEPKPRKKKQNFFQRWLQRRAQKKMQKQMEIMEAEEKRMDALLEKIQRTGAESLTDEENRFLKRVSNRYRNRQ